jgi:hypothetical protein
VVLTAIDAEALDAYVAAEFRTAKVPAILRARAEKLEDMVRLITEPPAAAAMSNYGLTDRTMRRIAAAERDRASYEAPEPLRPVGGFRFADLISVAAVLLLGAAVLWPVLTTVRGHQQRGDCLANLGRVASALGQYTGDYQGSLPIASASYGGTWLDVGSSADRSNSANLFNLFRSSYVPLRDLACAGNPNCVQNPVDKSAHDWRALPEVSYSYYIMFGETHPTPDSNPETIILADKSPVVIRASTGQTIRFPRENSPNHGGRGQWALRANGSAVWLASPQVGTDNIWLNQQGEQAWAKFEAALPEILAQFAKGARSGVVGVPNGAAQSGAVGVPGGTLTGSELPQSPSDSFLGP